MLERVLREQDGVIAHGQALACGLTEKKIEVLLRTGRWQRVHLGVYAAFSGPVPRVALIWAAVLRAGPGAIASHETAAELDGFASGDKRFPVIHLTIPSDRQAIGVSGVRVHYSSRVAEAQHAVKRPPRSRVEETVIDLTQTARHLDQAMNSISAACGHGLTTPGHIAAALRLRYRVRWRAELREALGDIAAGAHSLLERRYLHRVERPHRLPKGQRQTRVTRYSRTTYDDVRYREYRTVVELDGAAFHPDEQRRGDAARDNATVEEGDAPLRYGWGDVTERPCETAAQLARTLQRRGWPGTPAPCTPGCPASATSRAA